MTDTQEAMREQRERDCMAAFEANYIENENGENPPSRIQGGGYSDYRLHAEYLKFRIGYTAATAQSAEKIEYYKSANEELLEEGRNQREKIARLEESLAIFTSANDTLVAKINKELRRAAAAELSNKQLREVLENPHAHGKFCNYGAEIIKGQRVTTCTCALKEALAQQPSTEALDAYVASKIPVWQPIETAPKDGTEILLARFGGESNSMWWASNGSWITQFEFEGWTDGQVGDDGELEAFAVPTHWMPLPPAPEKE